MKSRRTRGFTLVELLVAIAVAGVIAAVAVPLFSNYLASKKLDVAAEEVANTMRFALSEANRTGAYILIDASSAGQLSLFNSDASGAKLSAVSDPLSKRSMDINPASSAFSSGVGMTPKFMGGALTCNQLLIGPGTQLQAFNNGTLCGQLQTGSGVTLTLGSQSTVVAINEVTGLVTLP
jgi:type II secretion system protein H